MRLQKETQKLRSDVDRFDNKTSDIFTAEKIEAILSFGSPLFWRLKSLKTYNQQKGIYWLV